MAADTSGEMLVKTLARKSELECKLAVDGERIETGCIYIAPSDHHLLVEKGVVLVTKGARENRSRPSIDPLFRSAAVAYGHGVIAVVLTGYLDDGTAGMMAVKRCGGTCIVQYPKDAAYPDMPQNSLNNLKVDHCVPLAQMGNLVRYRCHTGHAFTSAVLLAEQTTKIEETLWVALRMFEERRNLLTTLSASGRGKESHAGRSVSDRAKDSEIHINRIRAMLISGNNATHNGAKKA